MATHSQHIPGILSAAKGLLGKRDAKDDKELQEDFLKTLYERGGSMSLEETHREAKGLNVSAESLAAMVGALILNGELTADRRLQLTDAGRKHALKLIRAHRIYEQYLAEHSGYAPPEWHERAHRMEHRMSEAERERIASLLGNPLFDPHGDPIPTPSLEIPAQERSGKPLAAQSWWRILHVEDDDRARFVEITDKGLTKDSILFITHIDNLGFTFRYEGERFSLPIDALSALNLEAMTTEEVALCPETRARRLVHLETGKTVRIVGLSPSCRGALRRRLMDLGFVRGSRVSIDMASPLGNPVAYVVRGTVIALRHDQARYILFQSDEEGLTETPVSAPESTHER